MLLLDEVCTWVGIRFTARRVSSCQRIAFRFVSSQQAGCRPQTWDSIQAVGRSAASSQLWLCLTRLGQTLVNNGLTQLLQLSENLTLRLRS
jgi:hypothetical protein